MTLDEEALKRYIAKLPDLDNEQEVFGLGEEEKTYVIGVRNAYKILTGEEPSTGLAGPIMRETAKIRNHEHDWYESLPRGSGVASCGTCGILKGE